MSLFVYERRFDSSSDPVDWISKLPSDVLLMIISRLSTEEAVRTSLVSKRWEHLWKHMSHLVLDIRKKITNSNNTLHVWNRVATLMTKVPLSQILFFFVFFFKIFSQMIFVSLDYKQSPWTSRKLCNPPLLKRDAEYLDSITYRCKADQAFNTYTPCWTKELWRIYRVSPKLILISRAHITLAIYTHDQNISFLQQLPISQDPQNHMYARPRCWSRQQSPRILPFPRAACTKPHLQKQKWSFED